MKILSINRPSVIIIILLLTACTSPPAAHRMKMSAVHPNPQGIMPTTLLIEGVVGNIALASSAQLKSALDSYGVQNPSPNLGQLIQQIRTANGGKGAAGMAGIGGGNGRAFLDLAGDALHPGNGNFNAQKRVFVSLSGQITDYRFNDPDGDGKGTGKLDVTTYITRTIVTPGQGTPPSRTTAYQWKIEVENDAFEVRLKQSNADPFPNTIPPGSVDYAAMVQRINSLGFDHKLWARGTDIKVMEVWRDQNYNPNNPNFMLLDKTLRQYESLYEPSTENCIDMMFVGPPPAAMSGLTGPPFYCLGHCVDPAIINTR